MERIIEYLFVEFPEAMLVLLIAMAMFNINAIKLHKKSVVFALLSSLGGALLTELEVSYEIRIACSYLFASILLQVIFKIRLMSSMGVLAISFIAQLSSDAITLSIFNRFGIYFETMMSNTYTRYLAAVIYMLILFLIFIIFRFFKFDIRKVFPSEQKNRYLASLIIIMSIELLLILFINVNYYLGKGNEGLTLFKEDNENFVFTMILILFVIMSVNFYAYLKSSILQAQIETEEPYIKNLNEFVVKLRSVKHDAINHISVIQHLIQSNEIESAYDYADQVVSDINEVVEMVKEVKNLPLSAIIQSKKELCKVKEIEFIIDVESNWQLKNIKSNDLVTIFGNLLDNAIFSCEQQPVEERYIHVKWIEVDTSEKLIIENSGHISPDNISKIFNLGYTTKKDSGGTGLAVVKQLLEKYKGNAVVTSENNKVAFIITAPKSLMKP